MKILGYPSYFLVYMSITKIIHEIGNVKFIRLILIREIFKKRNIKIIKVTLSVQLLANLYLITPHLVITNHQLYKRY